MTPDTSKILAGTDVTTLISLARRFLQSPLTEQPVPFLGGMTSDESSTLGIIAKELKIDLSRTELSANETTRVLSLISTLLSTAVLQGERQQEAAKRLGSRGDLSLYLYKIRYGDIFQEFAKLGVKKSHVDEVLRDPDSVQHIAPPIGAKDGFPSLSFLAKRITPKRNPPFITLVQAQRRDDELHLQAVWRFPERIAIEAQSRQSNAAPSNPLIGLHPLDLLKSFIAEFGLSFSIPGMSKTKFLLYERVPFEGADFGKLVSIDHPTTSQFQANFNVRLTPGFAEIALAYVVDTGKYRREVLPDSD